MLPWDIEMTVEEPLSDDEDGAPHGVSDSESESEDDLTKFMRHVTPRVSVFFLIFNIIFILYIFTFFLMFDLQNQYRQIAHVLH
jgi:hypothetical protein